MINKFRERLFKIFKKNGFIGGLIDRLVNREVLTYLIFGVLTTAVNLLAFFTVKKIFISVGWKGVLNAALGPSGRRFLDPLGKGTDYLDATVAAWIIAVFFAFVTNKTVVFESKSWKPAEAGREFAGFIGARLFSLLVELVLMFVTVSLLDWNVFVSKVIAQIAVVILNYVFSKLFIFKRK